MSSASMRRGDEMAHGKARTKVAGDDEMLRTGFYNGSPIEAGKIADSEPVDLFAPARGVAQAHQAADDNNNQQQQQMRRPMMMEEQQQEQEAQEGKKQQQQVAGGGGVAAATENYSANPEQQKQGMAGGRRLGRQ
ncbi:hypothetical protein PR202_gb29068 [Eleusine coracana subsp. coracana]|uniref:Seed maturation protein n=1 Tax=Eleusine coracana subsp. coracana TaxID=191504 RepID=A0AAV5FZD0_ELECO|nr:hypothetical protein QOZ80_8BG0642000 [Eleusine coracana subsp. coracana]GJN39915.1 hypothetical protein PR202_gb29068 [Eleusine coracana subsp. coracana]